MKLLAAIIFSCNFFLASCIFNSDQKKKPDQDNKSIPNPTDDKPDNNTQVVMQDTDKDGINDDADKCPAEPGTVANNGCPETPATNGGATPADNGARIKRGQKIILPNRDSTVVN